MSDVSYIVDALNSSPFNRGLRVVEFHDKSPRELQLELGEVITIIDPKQPNGDALKNESSDLFSTRAISFLQMCKFQVPDDATGYGMYLSALTSGDKTTIYPIMVWLLQRIPQLQKRTYVARFLMPIGVPFELKQDPNLIELFDQYKDLQDEFKVAHKAVDALRSSSNLQPQDLNADIRQLDKEKEQLKERIAKSLHLGSKEPGFDYALKATSAIRHAQEEGLRLANREEEEKALLMSIENQLSEVTKRLYQINAYEGCDADEIIAQLKTEVKSLTVKTKQVLPKELLSCKRELKRLQKFQQQQIVTGEDVDGLKFTISTLQAKNDSTKRIIEETLSKTRWDTSNLSMFRQQFALATKSAKEKEKEYEDLLQEQADLIEDIREQESLATAQGWDGNTNKSMSPISTTTRHVMTPQPKVSTIFTSAEQEEEKWGSEEKKEELAVEAVGFAKLNNYLEETSDLVNHISTQLKSSSVDGLNATIADLEIEKKKLHDLEALHVKMKNRYDKVAKGFQVEQQRLQRECNELNEETNIEETSYHSLVHLNTVNKEKLKRNEQEEAWQRGEGRLNSDFQCYKDFYRHQLREKKSLSEELHHKKQSLGDVDRGPTDQRKYFSDLYMLLRCKVESKQKETGNSESKDNTYNTVHDFATSSCGSRMDGGGANVMKLE